MPRDMKYLDWTLPTPAENLACDEALLDFCEAGACGGVLRFWEPREHFVVLGYANRAGQEVNVNACRSRRMPILRRCTGGGTVLQGPGCLNYSLVLPIDSSTELQTITGTNCSIMSRHREALTSLLNAPVAVKGFTDLALEDLKFSGNAQRRKRECLLFHGTFLLGFDIAMVEELLLSPSRQPEYRRNRSHSSFLTHLDVPGASIKAALRQCWDASEPMKECPPAAIDRLVQEKYANDQWNLKW